MKNKMSAQDLIAKVYDTKREALVEFQDYVISNEDFIESIDKRTMTVKTYYGEIHFMSYDEYMKWRLGKTYYINGQKYHSGYAVDDDY